ncbi:hypothetical protein [Thermococcus stetteri]|uniref:hypothetical protein n=1 Tax=Thermococcus stetteri TaxID=49900 RepID=UPI001AE3C0F4|nr:hypothetical protein [Thermococcus stetteri]MBP1913004.1 hypothetical protein [Thermococcus stetteri]
MDLETQLILFIIFAFVGFITYQLWGFDVYKLYSDVGSMIFIITLMSFMLPAIFNPSGTPPKEMEWRLTNVITYFVESLPSMVIGDVAGTFVSAVVGEKR